MTTMAVLAPSLAGCYWCELV